jgi:hypothetical protein
MNHLEGFEKFNESNFFKRIIEERKKDKILTKADIQLRKHLKKYFLKKFSFQYSVHVWKSKHENYQEIDVADFEFIDLMIQPRFDWDTDKVEEFFLYLFFIDKYGDKISFHFDMNSPTEKIIDLEYVKPWEMKFENSFNASYVDEEDNINYDDPSRYPTRKGGGAMYLVPNEYKTYEFLKDIKSVLEMINDNFKYK